MMTPWAVTGNYKVRHVSVAKSVRRRSDTSFYLAAACAPEATGNWLPYESFVSCRE